MFEPRQSPAFRTMQFELRVFWFFDFLYMIKLAQAQFAVHNSHKVLDFDQREEGVS